MGAFEAVEIVKQSVFFNCKKSWRVWCRKIGKNNIAFSIFYKKIENFAAGRGFLAIFENDAQKVLGAGAGAGAGAGSSKWVKIASKGAQIAFEAVFGRLRRFSGV